MSGAAVPSLSIPAARLAPLRECRFSSRASNDGHLLEANVQIGEGSYSFYFKCDAVPLARKSEALLSAVLLPCLLEGVPVDVDGSVSPRLLHSLHSIGDFYRVWDPSFREIEIKNATPVDRPAQTQGRVGMFFSCGLDSYYTLLKHRDEITDLIFIHGFDIRLHEHDRRKATAQMVRDVGAHFGKRVLEVETSLRRFLCFDYKLSWGPFACGPTLVTVGHLLAPYFRKIYIASSYTYAQLEATCGIHPLLEPLWSTESLEFVHDGCEATRITKAQSIAHCQIALRTLRVCWENPNGVRNCGQCEKCLRTMINLLVAGALDHCTTFDAPLDPSRVAKLKLAPTDIKFFEQNLQVLSPDPQHQELCRAMRTALRRSRWHNQIVPALALQYPRTGRALEKLHSAFHNARNRVNNLALRVLRRCRRLLPA